MENITPVPDTSAPLEKPATLAETIQKALENQIFSGALIPGARLDEAEISAQFGASRTPVREAFKALEALGLVEMRGRQGVTVATLSLPMLTEMFEVMAALEGLCARFAARRATPAQKAAMIATHAELTQALSTQDSPRFYEINAVFHDQLYEASNTAYVAEQTRALRKRVAPYRRFVTYQPGRMTSTIDEHQRIIDAIVKADADGAQLAASDHVVLLGDDLVDFIAAVPHLQTVSNASFMS
ncbi:GntR family transcriptional regulator [Robbsia sp. KACC 23696]|uniref:GntR family transcriptional regulator n=1 Tax=Robbsia sp. KACC 23696 TaxID=3149231 RepID=UPI00325B2D3C